MGDWTLDPDKPSPWYRLDVDGCPFRLTWGEYLAWSAPLATEAQREVGYTALGYPDGRLVLVSTIYLAMDVGPGLHNDPPVLWETMVFGGGDDLHGWQDRYASAQDARDGHRRVVMGLVDVGWSVPPDQPPG